MRSRGFTITQFLVAIALMAILAILAAGCRGMSRMGDDPGIGRSVKAYEVHVAPNARSIINIGNSGQNVPMYQMPEYTAEGTNPFFTGGQMPASGAQNAGTQQAKYGIQVINDGVKRSAETDLATAATLAQGLQQSTVGQTAPQTQREGTSTGTTEQTSSPRSGNTTQVNPNSAVTGKGVAEVSTPTSTQAGTESQPGAVSGGATDRTGDQAVTDGDTTSSTSGTTATAESAEPLYAQAVTRNDDGTVAVQASDGNTYTGQAIGPFEDAENGADWWWIQPASGAATKIYAAGERADALSATATTTPTDAASSP